MVTYSTIRHLLSDKESLADYYSGNIPSLEDIRLRIFLLERQENVYIPDHYYRMNVKKGFNGINSIGQLLRIGLYRLGEEHLELRDNRIYVKQTKQHQWQNLITYIPPLIIQMAFLHIKMPIKSRNNSDIIMYYDKYIVPNTKNTALPYPYISQLETYLKNVGGLHDLHMHLNGSTESDRAWSDFLTEPNKVYKEIKSASKKTLVKEQIEQELGRYSTQDFTNMLYCARAIRDILFVYLFDASFNKTECLPRELLFNILNEGRNKNSNYGSAYHPFGRIIIEDPNNNPKYPLAVEGLMYILIFNDLAIYDKESIASIFHFYLLILGLCNRLLVQQTDQFGFEQFQKITINELRSRSEKKYINRFFQLSGNECRNILYLEGRFSPKSSESENIKLLTSIYDGWDKLTKELQQSSDNPKPTLQLIAHFIKQKEDNADEHIRFKNLRKDIWTKAQILGFMHSKQFELLHNVVGIDAAANELDSPPEVFSPAFRYLRRMGFRHFTYHAGEDFFHIISGLRAIYEAVIFNDMTNGDRIGHASAAGISTEIWQRNIGDKLFMRKGEYLDDLIFTYFIIVDRKCRELSHVLPSLLNRIHELSYEIYEKSYPVNILIDAWMLRRYCPILLFESKDLIKSSLYDKYEYDEIEKQSITGERFELLQKYHNILFREKYDEIEEIEVAEFYSMSDLEILQLLVLQILHEKEIVIETLPTSNIRIGHHHSYDTYQLWNWIRWEKKGRAIPPIVLGSDDPGIFATNIYNEYANIYCHLVHVIKCSHNEAIEIIKKLNHNGYVYRFD